MHPRGDQLFQKVLHDDDGNMIPEQSKSGSGIMKLQSVSGKESKTEPRKARNSERFEGPSGRFLSRDGTDVEVTRLGDEDSGAAAAAAPTAAALGLSTQIVPAPKFTCTYGHPMKDARQLDSDARAQVPDACSRCGLVIDKKEESFWFCEECKYALGAFSQHDMQHLESPLGDE